MVTRIDVLLVGFAASHTRAALFQSERLLDGLRVDKKTLIANSDVCASMEVPSGWTVVRGSNRQGEFSGWQEGIDSGDEDVFRICMNDTLGTTRHPSIFRRHAFRRAVRRTGMSTFAGFVDHDVPRAYDMYINGLPCHTAVSTYLFTLPPRLLALLNGQIYEPHEITSLVPGGVDERNFFSGAISPGMRQHLSWWLFRGGWSRSEPLSAQSEMRLRMKARSIVAELLLSAKAREFGFIHQDVFYKNGLYKGLDRINSLLFKLRKQITP